MDGGDRYLNLANLDTHLALGCEGLVNGFLWKSQSNKEFSVNPTSFLCFSSALNGFFPLDLCLVLLCLGRAILGARIPR